MKDNKHTNYPKQVVYLIGAGATQAEVDYQGGERVNLLMKDSDSLGNGVSTRVLEKAKGLSIPKEGEKDIEKLISLLAATGIEKYRKAAEKLREFYYEVIINSLVKTGIFEKPDLATGLLELHKNKLFNENAEKLTGIINLNHDNLFQIASQKLYGCIFLGFKFQSAFFKENRAAPLIIKPHGSFDWRVGLPIKVLKLDSSIKYSKDMLWIPPTILKESKDYPYNKLMGLAYELLVKKCDILRIIGCSLSQNDWNMVSLLFNAQYSHYLHKGTCFRIELIMSQKDCQKIAKEYSYLQNIVPIEHLTDGDFSVYKDEIREEEIPRTSDLGNAFKYWLKTKAEHHKKRGEIDIDISGVLKEILEV